jgi:hypothetical protein
VPASSESRSGPAWKASGWWARATKKTANSSANSVISQKMPTHIALLPGMRPLLLR